MGIKTTRIVGALALAGALMSNGLASAAQPAPVMQGDLNPPRTSADVVIPVECAAPTVNGTTSTTTTANVTVKIFQTNGRLLNIGTGSGTPTCTGNTVDLAVTVDAIPGLKFLPGPATILITLTETTTTTTEAVPPATEPTVVISTVVTEAGARINLKP